jgi:hypothetical protein
MIRKRPLLFGSAALLVVICVTFLGVTGWNRAGVAAVGNPTATPNTPPPLTIPAAFLPTTLPSYINAKDLVKPPPSVFPTPGYATTRSGGPAITPTLATTDAWTPAFTEQDVRSYYAKLKNPITSDIASITFTTLGAAAQPPLSLHPSTRYAADTLVCVVRINGSFVEGSKLGPETAIPTNFTREYDVFDAHTGNSLRTDYF